MAVGDTVTSPASSFNLPGPRTSHIQVAKPFVFEQQIQDCLGSASVTQAKDDSIRLQGVAWIDSVRKSLQLPVRTFDTAVVYYHKFRLAHPDNEYIYTDAAAAALFTACKIEDTLKKSKDVLCAAYNLKLPPTDHLSSDDPIFESPSKTIIGLERLMLEASGFDFRVRHPQTLLVKLARYHNADRHTVSKTAYDISIDMYRTYIPLKQSSFTMAISCLELAARMHNVEPRDLFGPDGVDYRKWSSSREEVMETLLDLLDLYIHQRPLTSVGPRHPINVFLNVRIALNHESSDRNYPRYTEWTEKRKHLINGVSSHSGYRGTNASPKSRRTTDDKSSPASKSPSSITGVRSRPGDRGRDGTVRFMLEPDRAAKEKSIVSEYTKLEEYEGEAE